MPHGVEYGLLHFVGAPKPWDLFGKWLNPSALEFCNMRGAVSSDFTQIQRLMGLRSRLRRAWRIRRPYVSSVKKKVSRLKLIRNLHERKRVA